MDSLHSQVENFTISMFLNNSNLSPCSVSIFQYIQPLQLHYLFLSPILMKMEFLIYIHIIFM
jgi:hypothetical protein